MKFAIFSHSILSGILILGLSIPAQAMEESIHSQASEAPTPKKTAKKRKAEKEALKLLERSVPRQKMKSSDTDSPSLSPHSTDLCMDESALAYFSRIGVHPTPPGFIPGMEEILNSDSETKAPSKAELDESQYWERVDKQYAKDRLKLPQGRNNDSKLDTFFNSEEFEVEANTFVGGFDVGIADTVGPPGLRRYGFNEDGAFIGKNLKRKIGFAGVIDGHGNNAKPGKGMLKYPKHISHLAVSLINEMLKDRLTAMSSNDRADKDKMRSMIKEMFISSKDLENPSGVPAGADKDGKVLNEALLKNTVHGAIHLETHIKQIGKDKKDYRSDSGAVFGGFVMQVLPSTDKQRERIVLDIFSQGDVEIFWIGEDPRSGEALVKRLNYVHRFSNKEERERVQDLGAKLVYVNKDNKEVPADQPGRWVFKKSGLSVPRSLGHTGLALNRDLDVSRFEVPDNTVAMLVACDGVTGPLSGDQLGEIAFQYLRQKKTAQQVARVLLEETIRRERTDAAAADNASLMLFAKEGYKFKAR